MKKFIFSIALGLFCLYSLNAQKSCDRWYLGINGMYFAPIQELKEGGFNDGLGVSMDIAYNLTPNNTKIEWDLGLRMNGLLGFAKRDEIELADPVGAFAKTRVYNSFLDGELMLRAIFNPYEKLRIYGEGFLGARYSSGQEKLSLTESFAGYDDNSTEQVVTQVNWVAGAGIGLLYKLGNRVDLDLRFAYDYSPELSYIDLETHKKVANDLFYDLSKSKAQNLSLHLGLRIQLDCANSNNTRNRRYRNRNRSTLPNTNKKIQKKTKGGNG